DVKPDNILLEAGTGRALVTDFGIAHGGTDAAPTTDPGKIMGTAHFMSPEQAAGEPIDGRSDIYALGVVGCLPPSVPRSTDASRATLQRASAMGKRWPRHSRHHLPASWRCRRRCVRG